MNHSQPCTAARSAGGGGPVGREPGEDLLRRPGAHLVDELAHLGVRRRSLRSSFAVGIGVVLDPAEERVERARELLDRRERGVELR